MNLFKETFESLIWLLKILKVFLKVRPVLTVLVILISTFSMIAHIVAFLLPIKAILLIGGEGVPKYFAGFIQPEEKMAWAAGLAIASVLSYLLTLVLDALNENLSIQGASKVVSAANEMKVFARQDEIAAKFYEKVTSLFSLLLFMLIALTTLYIVNAKVLVYFSALVSGLFLLTALVLASGKKSKGIVATYIPSNPVALWIVNNIKDYISILTSIIFMACFFVILQPYFYGDGPNILLSLISFILIRHSTNRAEQVIKKTINISKSKQNINTLVFKHHQKEKKSRIENIDFNNIFEKEIREKGLALILGIDNKDEKELISRWVDTDIIGLRFFDIEVKNANKRDFYQLQIFSEKTKHLYERELFLFQYMTRKELKAPEALGSYDVEEYRCQVVDAGVGNKVLKKEWDVISGDWAAYYASIKPSPDLVKAYKQSNQLLYQRLTHAFIEPVQLAVNSEEDNLALTEFKSKLELLQKKISDMPLYVHNDILIPQNIFWANQEHDDILVMTWRRWTLEPIGSNLSLKALEDQNELETYVKRVTESRKGIKKKAISAEDMILMSYCQGLEVHIIDEQYNRALVFIKKINALQVI